MRNDIRNRPKIKSKNQYVPTYILYSIFFKSFDTTTQRIDIIPLPIRHAQQRRYISLKIQYRCFLAEKKYKDRFL